MTPSRCMRPKCFYTGAFGGRCKYHDCYCCGYSFCFLCLESKEECQHKYNRTRNQEFHKVLCRETKQQTYSMFPRIGSNRKSFIRLDHFFLYQIKFILFSRNVLISLSTDVRQSSRLFSAVLGANLFLQTHRKMRGRQVHSHRET